MHPAKTHAERSHYRHVCQAGEDDCAQIPHDRHPGRPDPTETPNDYPLNQRDIRKLLDLQTATYNTLLTKPHFIHCLHTLSHLPILCLQARNRQRGKASLLQPPAKPLDAQPAPARNLSSLTTASPPISASTLAGVWGSCCKALGKTIPCQEQTVTWRSAEPPHDQYSAIQQVQGLRGTKSPETESRCLESGSSTCLLLLLKKRKGHLSILQHS